jgi:type III pantothenate kinase
MNLAIDIGNTYIKAGYYESELLIRFEKFKNTGLHQFLNQSVNESIDRSIICSVTSIDDKLKDKISSLSLRKPIVFSPKCQIPIKIKYKTPETLGNDRLALACGAYYKFPSSDTLIIDTGTCITFDIINNKGEYLGGSISPGLKMRYKALNTFTSRLPLVKPANRDTPVIGNSTIGSMNSGILNGIIFEINGFIQSYNLKYPGMKIIITGGDSIFFSKRIKYPIFVDQNFLLYSLNQILINV